MSYTRPIRNRAMRPMEADRPYHVPLWAPDTLVERIRQALERIRRSGGTPDRVWLPEADLRRLRAELGRPWNWTVRDYDDVPVHQGDVAMVTYAGVGPGGHGCILL